MGRALRRMRAVRGVAYKIIDFLAQLENFQKRLWLKKKFVLETQYCVTLDRVPETLYPAIAANEAQREEWVALLAIDEIVADLGNGGVGYSNPLTVDFLKDHPYLVLDTRHFNEDFRDDLLAALSETGSLDEQMDGLLIHGENFQALNLLQTRYKGKVQCVYIDPPYNTGDSEILYKNAYLRSSWLTFIENRLSIVQGLFAQDPVLYIAIDDFEMVNLAKLLDTEYPFLRRETVIVNHHPQGGKAKTLAHTHEYMVVCVKASSDRTLVGRKTNKEGVEERAFKRSGTAESNFRYGRPNSFYAILVDPISKAVMGLEPPPTGDKYPVGLTHNNLLRIYPLGSKGEERVWRKSYESCNELIIQNRLICSARDSIYYLVEGTSALFSNWVGKRYNAGTKGANLLRDILGVHNPFSYPKSIHTVEDAIFAIDVKDACILDYFAGSGTTAHAIINLNRNDGGHRKYVLVEMANYFDTVILPRLKKIIYSSTYKEGKPVSRNGITQLFKYVRLESYEDTLDALELTPQNDLQKGLLAQNPELTEGLSAKICAGFRDIGECHPFREAIL